VADDLSAPLGPRRSKKRFTVPVVVQRATAAALGLCVAVFVIWALVVDDPLGGEPMVRVPIDIHAAAPAVKPGDKGDTKQNAAGPSVVDAGQAPNGGARSNPAGNQTVTIIDGSSGKRQEVSVPGSDEPKTKEGIDQRLLETSRHGPIPRVALDGARAAEVYAQPVDATKPDGPRIALVAVGLAVSSATTAEAFGKLPGPVTFALMPYGTDVDRLAARARGEHHEILLELPMEPFDYPDNDPGPQSLLTSLAPEQNVDRLHWLMSRFQGYVGVTNYMGARFTANEQALAPVLREISQRGLIYLDDATSPRSLAGQIAGANMLPFAKAVIVLDAVPTPTEIENALIKLEAVARDKGVAVGIINALPVSIDRVSQWVKRAETKGFVLVPITAATTKPKAS
jgi:polysaccharide deacetylase 2 family uncharacterized protein YibQ